MQERVKHPGTILLAVCMLFLSGQVAFSLQQSMQDNYDGYDLWLRYPAINDEQVRESYRSLISELVITGNSETMDIIRVETGQALESMFGTTLPVRGESTGNGSLVIGTPASSEIIRNLNLDSELNTTGDEGYIIKSVTTDGRDLTVIASSGEPGLLYGSYHFLRLIQTRSDVSNLDIIESPKIDLRLLNHWDNVVPSGLGSIERGYAGQTLWKWDDLPHTLDSRYEDYARTNASIGINGTVLNNVNAEPVLLTSEYLEKVAALADVFRPYGIKVYLSVNFASPMHPAENPQHKRWGGIGNLDTADPLDPDVRAWWREKADEVYEHIPDFGGFLIKADSEGMAGPSQYGRSHSEGANMLAEALAPHGGIVMWRAFVYSGVDDRVKNAYLEFLPHDGEFHDNVLVQVKNGPLDFQPREPYSPLFGALQQTPLMMELQVTQEYLGHSNYLVYLAPMWKEVLDFDTYAEGEGSTVGKIVDGTVHSNRLTGIAGVANTGSDRNWTGHEMAQSNWYSYGMLAWDHARSPEVLAEEWVRMTWSNDPDVVDSIMGMLMESHEASVNFMGPLGLNLTTDGGHYEPGHENRNGRYWFATEEGLGYDRTESGSDAVSQYFPPVKAMFNDINTIPEKYLLWFHFVEWDHTLNSGRSLWDELVYRYGEGVHSVDEMIETWTALEEKVDPARHDRVLNKLQIQREHASHWEEVSLEYFSRFSGKSY